MNQDANISLRFISTMMLGFHKDCIFCIYIKVNIVTVSNFRHYMVMLSTPQDIIPNFILELNQLA